ncbi:MAG: hypothetical protein AAB558_02400 [Patescibacteria group bacterium]
MSYALQQFEILNQERVVSIRELQMNPSKVLKGITRIMKNGKSIGFFLDKEALEDMLEDFEALNSPKYLASIRRADQEIREGKTLSLGKVMKKYGVKN